jgi:hypothetical protein
VWIDVARDGRLLFRYDPERELIQIQRRGEKETVDLREEKERHELERGKILDRHPDGRGHGASSLGAHSGAGG